MPTIILMEAKRITYNSYVFVLSLSPSHPLSPSLSPSHPISPSLSPSHPISHSVSQSLSHSLSHTVLGEESYCK